MIRSILPKEENGSQFVFYSDSCSGVKGSVEEKALKKMNKVIMDMSSIPDFILFPGDEIIGMTRDRKVLIDQWNYWKKKEMAWFAKKNIPIYNTPGNHTLYDVESEDVFREINDHLPDNGPENQKKLSYFILRNDLLLVFVNTLNRELGGEGHIEVTWLEEVLKAHSNIKYKIVIGHHPIYPVPSMNSDYELHICQNNGKSVWNLFKTYKVFAYFCSHILDYDLQVHHGIIQVLSGGAGRSRRYLHLIQGSIDSSGLRYQVLNSRKRQDHYFSWPIELPCAEMWSKLDFENRSPVAIREKKTKRHIIIWEINIYTYKRCVEAMQTIISGWNNEADLFTFWIGLIGKDQELVVEVRPEKNKSPMYWHGPKIDTSKDCKIQIALHTGMGANGVLWKLNDEDGWNTFYTANNYGIENITWPLNWSINHDGHEKDRLPFLVGELDVYYCIINY